MANMTFTLADAKAAVYIRLGGMSLVEENVGVSAVEKEISAAQLAVLVDCPSPLVAGSCYASQDVPGSNGTHVLPSDAVYPVSVQVPGGRAIRYADMDAFFRIPQSAPWSFSEEYGWFAFSQSVMVRPYAATVTVHYIKTPQELTSDSDVLSVAPVCFGAVCDRAAWGVAGQWRDFPTDRLALLEQAYRSSIRSLAYISGLTIKAAAEAG